MVDDRLTEIARARLRHAVPASPEALIAQAWVGNEDRAALVARLAGINYTEGDHASDRAESGSGVWSQVRQARRLGLLSRSEYAKVAVAAGRPGAAAQGALRAQRQPHVDAVRQVLARMDAPAWREVREILGSAGWNADDLLAWAAAPNAWLDGRQPADEIRDHPEGVTGELRRAVTRAVPRD